MLSRVGRELADKTAGTRGMVVGNITNTSKSVASYGLIRSAMPVDKELLEILACPNCKTPVRLVNNGQGLKCDKCRRVYPIKDDIPVMLIDEATVDPD